MAQARRELAPAARLGRAYGHDPAAVIGEEPNEPRAQGRGEAGVAGAYQLDPARDLADRDGAQVEALGRGARR